MARSKTTPATIEHDEIDSNNQLTTISNEMAALSTLIIKQYGHDIPYSREHYLSKARGHIMRSAEEVLELGRCLIVMKEHEPHGEWLPILEDLSVDHTFAKRTMQAAIKFAGASTSKNLIEAAKSKSKLFELMVLDDELLEQLNDGETVAGINLDSIDKMPVSELRKKLREAKGDLEAKDEVAASNAKRISELQEKAVLLKKLPADQRAKQLCAEIAAQQTSLDEELRTNFFNALQALVDHGGDDHQAFINAQIQMLDDAVKLLRDEFGGVGAAWEQAE